VHEYLRLLDSSFRGINGNIDLITSLNPHCCPWKNIFNLGIEEEENVFREILQQESSKQMFESLNGLIFKFEDLAWDMECSDSIKIA
jgi:hypothetical protein